MRLTPQADWTANAVADQADSVRKIMDGTLRAIDSTGTRRLSMRDISDSSGVSRGTLYRYFASKEEVLAAVSEYVCHSFERGIVEAAEGQADPIERFRSVMRFYARFTVERSPERIFEVEPSFHLNFLRSHFARHKAAVARALGPVLDHFETLTVRTMDRDIFCDTLVRLQLSTLIIPATEDWLKVWNDAPDRLLAWALEIAGRCPEQVKG